MTTQRQIPGGPFVNETGTRQAQIPGGPFVNETAAAGGGGGGGAAAGSQEHQIPWSQRPYGHFELDRENPLNAGLDVYALPETADAYGVVAGSVLREVCVAGPAMVVQPGETGNALTLSAAAVPGEITVLAVTLFRDLNATTFAGGQNNSGAVIYSQRSSETDLSPTFCVSNQAFSGGQMRAWFGLDTTGTASGWVHSQVIETQRVYCMAASLGASGGGLVAIDGSVESNVYTTAGSFSSAWTGSAIVGGHNTWPEGGLRDNASQEIYLFLRWRRRLSAEELASVTANPWQVFKPVTIATGRFSPAPAGAVYEVGLSEVSSAADAVPASAQISVSLTDGSSAGDFYFTSAEMMAALLEAASGGDSSIGSLAGVPTLSLARAVDITSSSARPRVTLTF